ncbi:SH3 domain-containing protein [Anaerolineae bacterium CFX9]|nr:SH3 domain-containing protein [Anaerolineae bacterium CFX9]
MGDRLNLLKEMLMRSMRSFFLIVTVMALMGSLFPALAQGDCPGAPLPRLWVGGQGSVTPGSANNVRETPTTSGNLLGQLPGGTRFTVLEGPVCADGYNWWRVSSDTLIGWTVEGRGSDYFLAPGADREFRSWRPLEQHIRFYYDSTFAGSVESTHYPVMVSDADMIGATPEYVLLTFERFDESISRWVDNGTSIYVYDLTTFTPDMFLNDSLNGLRAALAERPAQPAFRAMLPYPYPQVFTARVAYHDLAGLSGVSYVTASSFDVSPITADRLNYLFQGLSDDGRYAVTLISALQTNLIPSSVPADLDYAAFEANWESYVADMVNVLNTASLDALSPIPALDTILSTLQLDPPEADFTSQDGRTIQIAYGDFSMTADAALGYRAQVNVTPGFIDPDGMSMFGSMPDEIAITFAGYPGNPLYQQPQVFLYPIDTFIMDSVYGETLQRLQQLLATQPAIATGLPNLDPGVTEIPFIPVYNAAQVIIARPEYHAFDSGVGLSFLTYYAQDISIATNQNLFYAFVGLTSDRRYVISATFPVTTDVLPATFDYTSVDYETFVEESVSILRQQVADLNNQPADGFTPSLSVLNGLIESIRVR